MTEAQATDGVDDVRDGQDGWELVEFEWYERSGRAVFDYVRHLKGGVTEERTITRRQPTRPDHMGWGAQQ